MKNTTKQSITSKTYGLEEVGKVYNLEIYHTKCPTCGEYVGITKYTSDESTDISPVVIEKGLVGLLGFCCNNVFIGWKPQKI